MLRELERRGPLLSREIDDHKPSGREAHRWWGERKMGLMLGVLNARGEVAVVGRRGKQRRLGPRRALVSRDGADPLGRGEARSSRSAASGRSACKLERGRLVAHPEADDPRPVASRVTFLSPFDRLVHDRDRAEALWGFYYRLEMYVPKAKREYGYYVLPILRGDRVIGRIEPLHDRKTRRAARARHLVGRRCASRLARQHRCGASPASWTRGWYPVPDQAQVPVPALG